MGLHTPRPDTPGTELVTDEDMRIDSFWPTQIVFAILHKLHFCAMAHFLPAYPCNTYRMDRRIFNANQWAQQERNQLSGVLTLKSVHRKKNIHINSTEVQALEKKKKEKIHASGSLPSNLLQYLTHMCWRVNIAIWMDPVIKEYQTNSETITNMLYKAPHGYTVHGELWICEQTASEHASHLGVLRQRSITVTSVGLYFMAGLGQWTVRWRWRDVTAQDLISTTPRGYQARACNERL